MFSSAAVAVTPSSMFSSAVVRVAPSSIFNSAAVEVKAVLSIVMLVAAKVVKVPAAGLGFPITVLLILLEPPPPIVTSVALRVPTTRVFVEGS